MSRDRFTIKRLVLVDSAGLCYVELPVDSHAMLLGKGNVGKSSLLNAIRLFLLPENNFKSSRRKFAFKVPKTDDYYSNDDSYNHYFPTPRSFLILEVENFVGTHCQILHATPNLGYSRIFTPLRYDQIRHLFWDGSAPETAEGEAVIEDDGIGRAVADLNASRLFNELKAVAPKTETANDTNKLKRLLYANNLLDANSMRYSLFPLAETDEARIDSLRTLILLLFEMNTGADTVARAVASIIEADKKFSSDALDFDIQQFLSKHEELKRAQERLVRIQNAQPRFNLLQRQYADYVGLADADKAYAAFAKGIKTQTQTLKSDAEQLSRALGEHQAVSKQQKLQLKQAQGEVHDLQTQLKVSQRRFEKEQKTVDAVEQLKLQYASNFSIDEIVEILQEELAESRERRDALANQEAAASRQQKLTMRNEQAKAREQQLKQTLENQEYLLSQQLPDHILAPLAAVNAQLVKANPCEPLDDDAREAIVNFSNLFKQSEGGHSYGFFDQSFQGNPSQFADDIAAELDRVLDELFDINKALKELSVDGDPAHRKHQIESLDREIKSLSHDLEKVQRYPVAQGIVQDERIELDKLSEQLMSAEQRLAIAQEQFDEVEQRTVASKQAYDTVSEQLVVALRLSQRQHELQNIYPRLARAVELFVESEQLVEQDGAKQSDAKQDEAQQDKASELTEAAYQKIESDLHKLEQLRQTIISELREFVHERFIEEDQEIRQQAPSSGAVKRCMQRLVDLFNELAQREQVLTHQIQEHNESVASYAKVLTDNYEHIQRFENQLNRDFREVSINDLEEVQVRIDINPKFRNLVNEIAKLDLHGDSLPSDQFYTRLQVFVGEFFKNGGDSRLTMDKIVTHLSYRTRKAGDSALQSKQQSNSTTALINFEMVQILLNRVLHSQCDVAMPLVFDEVATVDLAQFDWLLPHLKRRGFSLFAASTYSASPELIHKIGAHHEIGAMRTASPYSAGRNVVYWGGGEGFTGLDDPELDGLPLADVDQLGLLEHEA
ncbi:hypothetical protein ACFSJ3_16940 [Corallincola platygyrae]|uniref:ATP-binding protein n=1 Tax=Corallincola platygyrae TaxID=1193278 RepID=A0ABW4XTR5_9GAMM